MSIEHRQGKARPTLLRSYDLAVPGPAPSGPWDVTSSRLATGNPWAGDAKWRSLIAEGLGRDRRGRRERLVVARIACFAYAPNQSVGHPASNRLDGLFRVVISYRSRVPLGRQAARWEVPAEATLPGG
jgi:hypothetical protein